MSAVDDILGALPADQISQQVGATPDEVRTCAAAVLPALLGGLQANAGDPSGAGSILQALGQHDDDLLTGGADLSAIDEQDGTAIASHIFGDQQDEVVNRLGALPAVGGSGVGRRPGEEAAPDPRTDGAVLARQPGAQGWRRRPRWWQPRPSRPTLAVAAGRGGGSTPGSLDDLLRDVLGSAAGSAGSGGGSAARVRCRAAVRRRARGFDPGSIIGDVLGGILGGGRR